MTNPSPFPPKPGPPIEAPRHSKGFPGPVPRLEGRVAGAVRLAWNLVLSGAIGVMIGGVGSAMLHEVIETVSGPLGGTSQTVLSVVGWTAGIGSAFVLFMSYYLDDSQQ
ncbi:MAG: hypothetical protein ABI439_00260 [Rhodospirillales bacterium]